MSPATAGRVAALALLAAVALPGPAAAQEAKKKPEALTDGVRDRTPSSVVLKGRVNPRGADTRYFFQVGLTNLYDRGTPLTGAGAGSKRVAVSATVGDLAPATRYHYRLVAENRHGTTLGADKVFRTPPEPLGLVLGATPNPVAFNASTTVAGQITGTNNGGRQVVLQRSAWPYTTGFEAVGNPLVTHEDGTFAFPILNVPVNTQYRVVLPDKPELASPIVAVASAVQVFGKAGPRNPRKGNKVFFRGKTVPSTKGHPVLIQKLLDGVWTTKGKTTATEGAGGKGRYSKALRITRSGTFRALATDPDGSHVDNNAKKVKIKVRPRKR